MDRLTDHASRRPAPGDRRADDRRRWLSIMRRIVRQMDAPPPRPDPAPRPGRLGATAPEEDRAWRT